MYNLTSSLPLNDFSHSNTAEVEAAVQRERGGQEAKVTEGSQGGEDDAVMLLSHHSVSSSQCAAFLYVTLNSFSTHVLSPLQLGDFYLELHWDFQSWGEF